MASSTSETKPVVVVPPEVKALPYFIQSPTIEQCRAAIKGQSGFREVQKDDYVLFNYDFCFRGSFPNPYEAPTVEEALLRQTKRYDDVHRTRKFIGINSFDLPLVYSESAAASSSI